MDRQTNRKTDVKDKQMYGQTYMLDRCRSGETVRQIDTLIDKQRDRQIGAQINELTNAVKEKLK